MSKAIQDDELLKQGQNMKANRYKWFVARELGEDDGTFLTENPYFVNIISRHETLKEAEDALLKEIQRGE